MLPRGGAIQASMDEVARAMHHIAVLRHLDNEPIDVPEDREAVEVLAGVPDVAVPEDEPRAWKRMHKSRRPGWDDACSIETGHRAQKSLEKDTQDTDAAVGRRLSSKWLQTPLLLLLPLLLAMANQKAPESTRKHQINVEMANMKMFEEFQ